MLLFVMDFDANFSDVTSAETQVKGLDFPIGPELKQRTRTVVDYGDVWKPSPDSLAKRVGLPDNLIVSENCSVSTISSALALYEENLTIAKTNPDLFLKGLSDEVTYVTDTLFQASRLLVGEEVPYNEYGYQVLEKYTERREAEVKASGITDRRVLSETLFGIYDEPGLFKEAVDGIRLLFPDLSSTHQKDGQFLMAATKFMQETVEKVTDPVVSDKLKRIMGRSLTRSRAMPNGLVAHDTWNSPLFKGKNIPPSVYPSAFIRNTSKGDTNDVDRSAYQQIADRLSYYVSEPGIDPDMTIETPPNMTNGYHLELPYIDDGGNLSYQGVVMFQDISRINPQVLDADFMKGKVVVSPDVSGKLVEVKPRIDHHKIGLRRWIKSKQESFSTFLAGDVIKKGENLFLSSASSQEVAIGNTTKEKLLGE
jgi:hypothetical protein